LKKNTKCFNAAGEELSAVKHKLMLLDTAAEGRVNTANTIATAVICLATYQKFNFSKYIFEKEMANHTRIYVTPCHTKKIFGNMKRVGKGFSRRVTYLFLTMIVQAQEEIGEDITLMNDQEIFDVDKDLQGKEVVVEQEVVANEEPIVNVAHVSAAVTTITIDDITLAKALEALKTSKPKIRKLLKRIMKSQVNLEQQQQFLQRNYKTRVKLK
nr:hypothetical protein [Tanacetum cinerariifolium]